MNTLFQAFSALLAGAFLNIGLERLAEAFDPVSCSSGDVQPRELSAAVACVGPCQIIAEFDLAN